MDEQVKTNWLAYCVPTFNRAAAVSVGLNHIASLYQKYNIDIYYFDSSDNNDTQDIVSQYIARGFDNITYIRLDPSVSPDEKLIYILSGQGLKHDYKYIWPVKDRVYFPETAIVTLLNEQQYSYSSIFLVTVIHDNLLNYPPGRDGIYTDMGRFFYDWGMTATSLDATIFNYELLLKDIDWNSYREKFFINNENLFDHYAILFTQLSQIEQPQVRVLFRTQICPFAVLNVQSSSRKDMFHIWLDLWPAITNLLPECYNSYKEKVIVQTINLPHLLGSYDIFIKLYQDKLLTPDTFHSYQKQLETYSKVDLKVIEPLLKDDVNVVHMNIFLLFNQHLASQDYFNAYIIFKFNPCLESLIGAWDYAVLKQCFAIYELELLTRSTNIILTDCASYFDLMIKYLDLKRYIMANNIAQDERTYGNLLAFIKNNHVSQHFITNLISSIPFDKEKMQSSIARIQNELSL